jgi:hypothetical protein
MPLIRELIAIPERVHQSDFVLKPFEGVARADQTLRDDVVTPQQWKSDLHDAAHVSSSAVPRET